MIVYKDIFKKLQESGYSTYRIRQEKLISEATLERLRKGESVSTNTLDVICHLCKCQPADLIAYVD